MNASFQLSSNPTPPVVHHAIVQAPAPIPQRVSSTAAIDSLASTPPSLGKLLNQQQHQQQPQPLFELPSMKSTYQLPSLDTLLSSIPAIHTPISRTLPYPRSQQANYYPQPTSESVAIMSTMIPPPRTPQQQQQQPQQHNPHVSSMNSASTIASATEYYTPSGNPRKHVCKTCQKGFTTSGHLARHNRIHTGVKNHVCAFPGCEAKFSRHDNCMQHYKTHLKAKKGQRKMRM